MERSIQACKDIANAGKHLVLIFPSSVREVALSPGPDPTTTNWDGSPDNRPWRLKILLEDGNRLAMKDVAREAVALWQGFFVKHALMPVAPS